MSGDMEKDASRNINLVYSTHDKHQEKENELIGAAQTVDEDDGSRGDNNNNLAFHTGCDKFHPDALSPKHQGHKPLGKSKSARDAKCRISAIIPSSVSSCLENDNISHSATRRTLSTPSSELVKIAQVFFYDKEFFSCADFISFYVLAVVLARQPLICSNNRQIYIDKSGTEHGT
ncbi:hypothetical protein Fcan01_01259 [Folsomia candida]|uniref:Uncharacterized protein n=1 Tax=Folsomia candida TaxID=158441 RepID=A0A226EXI2_FOLCA|nr:hypothetical protein Fcan01_01259 [Folsomia candida]